ncbi:hypothetical protein BCR43DRAFT_561334 [Syncephalastrum racemosum]|uniref:DUF1754-domain-containing protein n=1 Tax=Syncephalastrum racemosum TaxID=13706 RepID=A0A1X2HNN0_SYNRA|nr:hypothetical protein BCR43DRAFT_561334 [Syncephalastrum racemosum]
MSAYDNASKKSLKFKGGESPTIKKKKKKSKSDKEKLKHAIEEAQQQPDQKRFTAVNKTEAELKFEEAQRRRQMDRISKAAKKSHKERVVEFNQRLEELSEHHDIPKVGPG